MNFNLYGFGPQLLNGAWLTVELAFCSLVLGLLMGLVGAAGKLSHQPTIRCFFTIYTAIVRGLPELLFLFGVYYGGTLLLSKLTNSYHEVNAFFAGVIALGLIFGAYATETLRGAYLAVNKGQLEAAKAFGFSNWKAFYHIMLPQIWRHALPGLGNLWLMLLKDTGIVSLLGLSELLNQAKLATVYTHQPFQFYVTAAIIYLIFTTLSVFALIYVSERVKKGSRHILL